MQTNMMLRKSNGRRNPKRGEFSGMVQWITFGTLALLIVIALVAVGYHYRDALGLTKNAEPASTSKVDPTNGGGESGSETPPDSEDADVKGSQDPGNKSDRPASQNGKGEMNEFATQNNGEGEMNEFATQNNGEGEMNEFATQNNGEGEMNEFATQKNGKGEMNEFATQNNGEGEMNDQPLVDLKNPEQSPPMNRQNVNKNRGQKKGRKRN